MDESEGRKAFPVTELKQLPNRVCLHQLQALEGAVEGIPKKDLSPEKKAELREYFKSMQ